MATSASAQVICITAAWLYMVLLHKGNDGLWYTGDAARHAINGFFWWDFLTTVPSDPRAFALRYYARYPAISPVSYPPVFYILEGLGYHFIAPSPFVAKGTVQIFTLLGALYVASWLRRWLQPEAGWGGALIVLQPGMITWSHAVMLNVPGTAVGVAALFHGRRWLESGSRRQAIFAVALATSALLTYFLAAIPLLVFPLWCLISRRREISLDWRFTGAAIAVAVLCLAPLALLVSRWAALPLSMAIPTTQRLFDYDSWIYYASRIPRLLDRAILVLAVLGVAAGIANRAVSREAALVASWILVAYGMLSMILARDDRYALFLVPPLVILATIGLWWSCRIAMKLVGKEVQFSFFASLAALIILDAYGAYWRRIPRAAGFEPIVAFLERQAAGGRVLYAGEYDGVFTYYLRAKDPAFRWAVVRASKLLYSSAILPDWRFAEHVSDANDVVSRLRTDCGCRWVAIETRNGGRAPRAIGDLRKALDNQGFERIASFPTDSERARAVDLYRVVMPIEFPRTLEIPFPILGKDTAFRVQPIER